MTRRFALAACALFAGAFLAARSVPAATAPGDWAEFRGPGGQGKSAATGLPTTWSPTEGIVWKTPLPGPGASVPIVLGNRIYLTSYTGFGVPGQPGSIDQLKRQISCLDRASGKILWTKEIPNQGGEQERIREEHGYASNTPVTDGERLYVFFGKGGVYAFDLNGKQLWRTSVGEGLNGWGSAASPIVWGDLLFVNASVESESLVALNKKTGAEVWRARGINESWNTPIVVTPPGGKPELVVAVFGKVLGFEPATGQPLWSCNTDIGWYMVPSNVAHEGIVYVIGGRTGGSLAIKTGGRGDVTRTHRLWKAGKGSNVSSPLYHEGRLYWAHEALGIAYCFDAKTGQVLYEERLDPGGRESQVYAAPVLAEGKIYYFLRNGRCVVVAATPKFQVLAVNDLGEPRTVFNSSPSLAGNRLLMRSDKFLYCIGK